MSKKRKREAEEAEFAARMWRKSIITRIEMLERERKYEKERAKRLYNIWTGLVCFLIAISVYFTASSTLEPFVGGLLIIAAIATLTLFVKSTR